MMHQLGRLRILFFQCQKCAVRNLLAARTTHCVNQSNFRTCRASHVLDLMPDTDRALAELRLRVMRAMVKLRDAGHKLPETLSERQWLEILKSLRQFGQRKKTIQKVVLKFFTELEEKRGTDSDDVSYNTFVRQYDTSEIEQLYNHRLAQAVCHGQDLVLDLNYSDYMTDPDKESLVRQIAILYNANKLDKDPFHLHLCNVKMDDRLLHELKVALPDLAVSKPLVTITEKNYLDILPKEKLVFLTPDTSEDLVEFNHEDIYIVGGMVTRGWDTPATLPKAQQEGIRAYRLPLDKYLFWGVGRKALTLYAVVNILLSLKNHASWKKALQHIPNQNLFWHPPGSTHQRNTESVETAIWPPQQDGVAFDDEIEYNNVK